MMAALLTRTSIPSLYFPTSVVASRILVWDDKSKIKSLEGTEGCDVLITSSTALRLLSFRPARIMREGGWAEIESTNSDPRFSGGTPVTSTLFS